MLTPEQIEFRRTHITGSDMNRIIIGRALDVFLEKTGRRPEADGVDPFLLRAGQLVEPFLRTLAAERWDMLIEPVPESIEHPKYSWLGGHLDGRLLNHEPAAIAELKNVGAHAARRWGESETDEIPDYYLGQPHTYMLLTDAELCYVVAYFGGADVRRYPIERDRELDALIVEASRELWEHIQRDEPPPVDYDDGATALADLRALYQRSTGETILLPDSCTAWHEVATEAAALEARYRNAKDAAHAHILAALGESETGMLPDGSSYRRKLVKRKGYTVAASEHWTLKHVIVR